MKSLFNDNYEDYESVGEKTKNLWFSDYLHEFYPYLDHFNKKIKETNDLLKTQTLLKIIPKNLQKITMMKVKHVCKVQLLL